MLKTIILVVLVLLVLAVAAVLVLAATKPDTFRSSARPASTLRRQRFSH